MKKDSLKFGLISGVAVFIVYTLTIDLELFFVFPGLVYGIVTSILFYKHVCKKHSRLILWTIACVLSFLGSFFSFVFLGESESFSGGWTLFLVSILGSAILLTAFLLLIRKPGLLNSLKTVIFPALVAYLFGWMIDPSHDIGGEFIPYLFLFVAWQTLVTVFLCSENGDKTKNSENVG